MPTFQRNLFLNEWDKQPFWLKFKGTQMEEITTNGFKLPQLLFYFPFPFIWDKHINVDHLHYIHTVQSHVYSLKSGCFEYKEQIVKREKYSLCTVNDIFWCGWYLDNWFIFLLHGNFEWIQTVSYLDFSWGKAKFWQLWADKLTTLLQLAYMQTEGKQQQSFPPTQRKNKQPKKKKSPPKQNI